MSAKIITIKESLPKQVGRVRAEGRKGAGRSIECFPIHLCRVPIRENSAQYLHDLGPPAYRDQSEKFKLQRTPQIKKQSEQFLMKLPGKNMCYTGNTQYEKKLRNRRLSMLKCRCSLQTKAEECRILWNPEQLNKDNYEAPNN